MDFIKDKHTWRAFLSQVDLMNTLNGGVSMTSVDVKETDRNIVITVATPSVDPEAFNVFVDHAKLIVYLALKNENHPVNQGFNVPMFFKTFDIPFFVDGDQIDALYEDHELTITLPFRKTNNENNLQRRIDIKHL